ncbi:helix-turn-helix domain-containing protein [Streptomyces acidiscabies]|uniref:helix-turn-helix domain-containing protein n=1 Tax=Streptomyces acidiscabies TaxID=42234 RepID=UPI00099C2C2E
MDAMMDDQNTFDASQPDDGLILSSVQARVLEGVAAGLSSGSLSRELYLSSKTIDYHVRVMSEKLQAPNRVALVARAFVLRILCTDSWPPRIAEETSD